MKVKKYILLVIVLILSYSTSYCQNDSISSTGVLTETITITIDDVKNINSKLIERQYLLQITNQQDSIINDYKSLVKQHDVVIDDLQNRIVKANKINEDISNKYKKEHTKTIIVGSLAGAFAATTVVFGIISYYK